MQRPTLFPSGGPNNVPLLMLRHRDLTIEGYSIAAVQTYWRIPELHVAFDHGAHPIRFTSTPVLAISHTHSDHIAGLPAMLTGREIQQLPPAKVLVPAASFHKVQELLRVWQDLTEDELACELVAALPETRYAITDHFFLEPFVTPHTIPSCGYLVGQDVLKLRPEYRDLSQTQIEDLGRRGVDLSEPETRYHAAYLGDSGIGGLQAHPAILSARVLIMEVTYFHEPKTIGDRQRYGHIHLDDVVAMAHAFENELIVFGHTSARYKADEILAYCQAKLPAEFLQRLVVWV